MSVDDKSNDINITMDELRKKNNVRWTISFLSYPLPSFTLIKDGDYNMMYLTNCIY